MESRKNQITKTMCPSYVAKAGAQLFGVISKEGKVNFISPISLTEEYLSRSDKSTLEQRFRFTGKCIEKGCAQWNSAQEKCTLSQKVSETVQQSVTALFFCPIRSSCRWFLQDGETACLSCNDILRNMEELLLENESS